MTKSAKQFLMKTSLSVQCWSVFCVLYMCVMFVYMCVINAEGKSPREQIEKAFVFGNFDSIISPY